MGADVGAVPIVVMWKKQDAGLVKRRQQGTTVYYSIADDMVFELCEMICSRLRDRLEAQVGALKARMRG